MSDADVRDLLCVGIGFVTAIVFLAMLLLLCNRRVKGKVA